MTAIVDKILDKVDILNALMTYKGFDKKTDFASFLGVTPQGLGYWYSAHSFDVNTVLSHFPEVNELYIRQGKGPMLKKDVPEAESKPYVMSRVQRIKAVIHYLLVNKLVESREAIASAMGITTSRLSTVINTDESQDLPRTFIPKLAELAPDVNMNWVLSGSGQMLNKTVVAEEVKIDVSKHAPVIPVEVMRSSTISVKDYLQANREQINFVEPSQLFPEFDFIARADSNNMFPAIGAGDLLFVKRVINPTKIVQGDCYLIDTRTIAKGVYYVRLKDGIYNCTSKCDGFDVLSILAEDVIDLFSIEGIFHINAIRHAVHDSTIRDAFKAQGRQLDKVIDQNTLLINQVADFMNVVKSKLS